MDAIVAMYLFMLAGIAGYMIIVNVPSVLHTPLMSGSNFVHGVVLAGAMIALGHAEGVLQTTLGFIAVVAGSANAVGGYVSTDRMMAMFESTSKHARERARAKAAKADADKPVDAASEEADNNG